jgi:hypothetical protein
VRSGWPEFGAVVELGGALDGEPHSEGGAAALLERHAE